MRAVLHFLGGIAIGGSAVWFMVLFILVSLWDHRRKHGPKCRCIG